MRTPYAASDRIIAQPPSHEDPVPTDIATIIADARGGIACAGKLIAAFDGIDTVRFYQVVQAPTDENTTNEGDPTGDRSAVDTPHTLHAPGSTQDQEAPVQFECISEMPATVEIALSPTGERVDPAAVLHQYIHRFTHPVIVLWEERDENDRVTRQGIAEECTDEQDAARFIRQHLISAGKYIAGGPDAWDADKLIETGSITDNIDGASGWYYRCERIWFIVPRIKLDMRSYELTPVVKSRTV